jgi:D-alanine-D-alanine ligase-like ATP-grasp enzyme
VTFQEYVPGVDLRVTVVGDQVFTAEIDATATSYPVDMRMVLDEAAMRPAGLPAAVEKSLLALTQRLGLTFGAADLRRRPDGRHVFLELNPAGQWLFVEARTGQPITSAVAGLLARLDQP